MANYYLGKSINPIVIFDLYWGITLNHSCEHQQSHENIGCSKSILPNNPLLPQRFKPYHRNRYATLAIKKLKRLDTMTITKSYFGEA